MTAPLPARLLAFRDAAESTNDDEGNDGRATYVPVSLQTFRQTMEEAAAALSGREAVGEVRIADGCIVSTSIKRPLPDGGYDVVPQGATTPQPGDGFPARFFADGPQGAFWTDSLAFARDLIAKFDRDDWTITDTAAPSAKGVA